MRPLLLLLVVAAPAAAQPAAPSPASPQADAPWRIGTAIGAPPWLTLGAEYQGRFEHLSHDFRRAATNDSTALTMRTLLRAEATRGSVVAGIELIDARTYASDATPLNTTLVDPLDLLQAFGGARTASTFVTDDQLDVRAGRITIDLSTRRLVARNRYRTTINGFTGVDAAWTSPHKHVARAFVAVPVTRLPTDADGLRDNSFELDEENTDAVLWCGYYGSPALGLGSQLELYAVGLHEHDGDVQSRNRQLVTFAARWFRKQSRGAIDFDVELLPQVGTSRATTAEDDTTDLTHIAVSTHAELGISPALARKPRLALLHDYASGDRDPDDDKMQRFDPLFGARRFDFGPTGTYGPFNRANIQSPGLRVSLAPAATLDATVTYRWFWLASRSDSWVAANVRDTTGDSGRFVAEHVEAQLRWTPRPKNLSVEAGAAYLRRGDFAKSAPGTRAANAAYVYTQLSVTL